jgi:hypothetical protein
LRAGPLRQAKRGEPLDDSGNDYLNFIQLNFIKKSINLRPPNTIEIG